jgi:hypothetical protein
VCVYQYVYGVVCNVMHVVYVDMYVCVLLVRVCIYVSILFKYVYVYACIKSRVCMYI